MNPGAAAGGFGQYQPPPPSSMPLPPGQLGQQQFQPGQPGQQQFQPNNPGQFYNNNNANVNTFPPQQPMQQQLQQPPYGPPQLGPQQQQMQPPLGPSQLGPQPQQPFMRPPQLGGGQIQPGPGMGQPPPQMMMPPGVGGPMMMQQQQQQQQQQLQQQPGMYQPGMGMAYQPGQPQMQYNNQQQPQMYDQQQQQMQQQQQQKMDLDQVPNPIEVMEQNNSKYGSGRVFETNEAGKVPPLNSTDFICSDLGNCNPRFIRSSMYSVPTNPDLMKQSKLPLVLNLTPFAEIRTEEVKPKIEQIFTKLVC
jgi:protein transport protein SEC24